MEKVEYRLGNTSVTIHSGYKTIGGNIVEIRYPDGSIIFDIGLNIGKYNEYFSWPLRMPRDINELIELDIAPDINGLYTEWDDEGKPILESGADTDIRAVFLSHAHYDHYGLLTQVNRNIPIYMGETAKHIIDLRRLKTDEKKFNSYIGIEDIRTFRHGVTIKIDEIHVTPLHVDHSIPGAYGFKIETRDGLIVYTGDYRLHGQTQSLTLDFIEEIRDDEVNLYITEGTRVHDVEHTTEEDVRNKLKWIMESTEETLIIECSPLDIDRFFSILSSALETGRKIFLSEAHYEYINNYYMKDPKLRRKLDELNYRDICTGLRRNVKIKKKAVRELWNEFSKHIDFIYIDEYNEKSSVILGLEYSLNLYRSKKISDKAIAIFSNSEPFNEESEIDFTKTLNWLNRYRIPSYRIHASGHISPLELKEVIQDIDPRDVIVMHSEYPETIKNMLGY